MDKTFSIKTLGCKLNQYESSEIANQLLQMGWIAKPFGKRVDIVIVNTCTVTDRSDKKCRNYIRQGARVSRWGKTIVTGCLAQRDPLSLKRMPEVLEVFGNNEKGSISSRIEELNNDTFQTIDDTKSPYCPNPLTKTYSEFKDISHPISSGGVDNDIEPPVPYFRTRGFMKIQDGCDGECTYCIIPTVRGIPKSRRYDDILEHSRRLIEIGCPEIILTGISIGRYSDEKKDLAELIKEIIALKGRFRVRISSIEPNHINPQLIDLFESERLCPHIHLPIQSGSDRILQMMKRPYGINDYMKIIDKIRSRLPDIAIGTDMIVGFPGEGEEDFQGSLKLIEEVGFSYVHQFTYSQRSTTPASIMKQNCTHGELLKRKEIMRQVQKGIGLRYREKFEGHSLSSVIEDNRSGEGFSATSDNYIKISLQESPLNQKMVGRIVDVHLKRIKIDKNFGYISSV